MPPVTSIITHQPFIDILCQKYHGKDDFMRLYDTSSDDLDDAICEGNRDCRLVIADRESWETHESKIQALMDHCYLKPYFLCLGQINYDTPHAKQISRPFKWGGFLDEIDHRLAISSENINLKKIDCAPYGHIDTQNSQWIAQNGQSVSLTDREIILLHSLAITQAGSLNKKTLYRAVWGYKDDLETHTLETHIYRLRQKIEPDPQNPVIIQTYDDSYLLINHDKNTQEST
jgi:hypothetical protein